MQKKKNNEVPRKFFVNTKSVQKCGKLLAYFVVLRTMTRRLWRLETTSVLTFDGDDNLPHLHCILPNMCIILCFGFTASTTITSTIRKTFQQEILDVIYWNGIRKYTHIYLHANFQFILVCYFLRSRIYQEYYIRHSKIICKHIWRRSWSLECVLMCHDCGLSPSSHHHHQHDSFVIFFFTKNQARKVYKHCLLFKCNVATFFMLTLTRLLLLLFSAFTFQKNIILVHFVCFCCILYGLFYLFRNDKEYIYSFIVCAHAHTLLNVRGRVKMKAYCVFFCAGLSNSKYWTVGEIGRE